MTRQKYKKLNLLLDSDVSFTQQEIKEELGLHILPNQLPTFKMFMVNFAEHREPLAFSVGNNQYPPRDFNIHDVTYSTVQGVVRKLDKSKLATFFIGKPRSRKAAAELSRLKPSKKLMDWVDEKFPYGDSVYLSPQTHVRLRDDKKNIVDYQSTFYTKHVDLVMKDYHQKLIEWGYCLDGVPQDKLHMYCNFGYYYQFPKDSKGNPNIRYGGRWWGKHNQISPKERIRRISFDFAEGGTDLVELDFTASILTALRYWELGREPETDHYKLFRHDSYVNRQHVKNLCSLLLNKRRDNIEEAYAKNFYVNKDKKPKKNLSLKQKVELHWVRDTAGRFMNKHHEIRHWFRRGRRYGALASFIEANLVLEIVRRCCNENIPVLTVYDSFIVPKKHKKRAYELMYQEDVFPFVKEVINSDEQDSVKRIFKGHLDFNSKQIKSMQRIAESKGLRLIDNAIFRNQYEYEFIKCGHRKLIEPKVIRENEPRCDDCIQKKLEHEAEDVGLILIGDGRDKNYRTYQFKKDVHGCEHIKEIHIQMVRENSFECKVCWEEELKTIGKKNGITVLEKGKRQNPEGTTGRELGVFWYKCIIDECGHHQEILPSHIRDKRFKNKCDTCILEKYEREAKEAGLELIGTTDNPNKRKYKRIICEHTLTLIVSNVRNRSFVCHECETTAYDLPSMVYLLKLTHQDLTWLKLGHAQFLKRRIKEYGLVKGVEVEEIKTIDFDTGKEATEYENKLHKKYKSSKINKEKMKDYMQCGFDECYKPKALDKLLEELEVKD